MSSLEAQLDESSRAALKRLTTPPRVAWPTVAVLAVSLLLLAGSYVAGFTRTVPLWAAALANVVVMYTLFSVIHDSIHRSVSQNQKLNDGCGRLASQAMSPGSNTGVFRWGHIQHHRFTTAEGDPDNWLHGGRNWTLPLRWAVIDIYYLINAIRSDQPVARKHLPYAYMGGAITLGLVGTLVALGYGLEVVMLWLVPTRVNSVLLGFTFLPLLYFPWVILAAAD